MKKFFLGLSIVLAAACGKQEHGCFHQDCQCEETGHCDHEGCNCACHHRNDGGRDDHGDDGCSGGSCKPDPIM